MELKSHRMPDFSPLVIWTRRWLYSIVSPPFFTIRGQGATSSTTSLRCCANRYTAASLATKMSMMPIVYRWIRRCEGSPERRSPKRMSPAPTRWVDLRPRCCPPRATSKPFRKSMANGWNEPGEDPHRRIILDMDSSASPVHGEQEASAYNGHFGCTCYHPLFCFNQFGDCEGSMLRPGNVHSADRRKELEVGSVCFGLQPGQFSAAFGPSQKNQILVPSQPLDQTNQDRSEGGSAWPDGHVSDGGSSGKQRDTGRDVVSD